MIVASPLVIRIGRTLSYMLYLIHLNACAYYIFSKMRGFGSTPFLYQGEGLAYVRCFYFAMKTATKIGKNPKPVNGTEETFMIFNWVIGVFACAALIGQVSRDHLLSIAVNHPIHWTDPRHYDGSRTQWNRIPGAAWPDGQFDGASQLARPHPGPCSYVVRLQQKHAKEFRYIFLSSNRVE